MSDFVNLFAAAVRAARLERSLSQEKLAEMAGCSADTIGNIERADTAPSIEVMVALARVLVLDVQGMIGVTPDGTTPRTADRLRGEAEAVVVARGLPDHPLGVWIEIGRLLGKRGL